MPIILIVINIVAQKRISNLLYLMQRLFINALQKQIFQISILFSIQSSPLHHLQDLVDRNFLYLLSLIRLVQQSNILSLQKIISDHHINYVKLHLVGEVYDPFLCRHPSFSLRFYTFKRLNKIEFINLQKNRMISKTKGQTPSVLEELRSQLPKKRLAAVSGLKQAALALGPLKVRAQLIKFLEEFLDDEQSIVLELLGQLDNFAACLGGIEYQKCLLPLLIMFCKTDQRAVAYKSSLMIQRILAFNQDLVIDTIKKISFSQMTIAKECGLQVIAKLLPKNQNIQKLAVQVMTALAKSQKVQDKITCAKYMSEIVKSIKSKEQLTKIFDMIYNDGDQLSKIYAIKSLMELYEVNASFCLTKFKNVSILNSWRLNLKICQIAECIFSKCTKAHFKLIFQPMFMKFMTSTEPELRAASCQSIFFVWQYMMDQEQKTKLIPIIKKLAGDQVQYVKIQLSQHIVKLCQISSIELLNESIFPIIFSFIRDANSEISIGIIKSYDYLIKKMNKEIFEDKIFKPLLQQLTTDNWRVKCQIIDILKTFIYKEIYLTEAIIKVIFALTDDKIDAVRLKVNELIVEIINKNSKEWSQKNIIPKIIYFKQNISYIKKQNFLDVIEKTCSTVSEKTLKDAYQNTILACLSDKVTNVKLKSLQVLKSNMKLCALVPEKHIQKLKEDKESEVRELAKKLRA